MKNAGKALIVVGVVGGLAYALWPMLTNAINRGGGAPSDTPDDLVTEDPETTLQPLILAQYETPKESMTDKVKRLQKLIGVTADGVAGPKTMERLNKYVGTPTLTSANIDTVINTLNYVVPAVNSLSSGRNDSPQRKGKQWEFWVNHVKKGKITFDPYINRAYSNVTGRSLYNDYANRTLSGLESLSGLI